MGTANFRGSVPKNYWGNKDKIRHKW